MAGQLVTLRIEIDQDNEKIIANRITVREVQMQREIMAPKTLLQMFEMDFSMSAGSDVRGLSQDDRSSSFNRDRFYVPRLLRVLFVLLFYLFLVDTSTMMRIIK